MPRGFLTWYLVGFGREGVVLERKLELVVGMSRRGHPAFPKAVSHRQPACPPQLERKQPYSTVISCSLPACRLPACLPACRAGNEKALGPWLSPRTWQAGRLPVICVGRPDLHLVSCSRRRLRGRCLGNVLSRTVLLQSLPPSAERAANDAHPRIVSGPGLASWLVASLRRMCFFAVETEDRFLPMPRPSQRPRSWRPRSIARPVLVMGWR